MVMGGDPEGYSESRAGTEWAIPYCLEMQLPAATDRDRFRLSPAFWRFAKCHQVCCWNWVFVETGCSKTQSCGLQPVNAPLERTGFRTKLGDFVWGGSWGLGTQTPLCECLWMRRGQSQDTHSSSQTLSYFRIQVCTTHSFPLGEGMGEGWEQLLHPGQCLVNIWSLRQGLEGIFSAAGMCHGTAQPPGMERHGNEKLWFWGCFTILDVECQRQRSNFLVISLHLIPFFLRWGEVLALYTGLSLLPVKLMVKLPPREACPALRSSQGLVEAVVTTTILFAIKEKINF